jgi:hypothetical protein
MKEFISIIIVFTLIGPVFSQVEKDSNESNIIEEINTSNLVHFANNNVLISEIQSSELHIKIYKVRKGFGGGDTDFLSKEFDLYVGVSTSTSKKLFKVTNLRNVRDIKWLEIGQVPEFRCNYASSSHTRTARFKIYSDRLERLY